VGQFDESDGDHRPGLFYRLREAEVWLARVLAQTLQQQVDRGRRVGACEWSMRRSSMDRERQARIGEHMC